MKIARSNTNGGFTIIELMVVVVIFCILASLVALTYSGVQAKNRNASRQKDIDTLKGQLENYYAGTESGTNMYPTFAQLSDPAWRTKNLKKLPANALQDPRWSKKNASCTAKDYAVASTKPETNCYSYQVTATDGSACDNVKVMCAHYTLTAILEGGEKYVKSSLN